MVGLGATLVFLQMTRSVSVNPAAVSVFWYRTNLSATLNALHTCQHTDCGVSDAKILELISEDVSVT